MTWESDHVESARARGVSWQNIAHQVGKCEWDIRRRYDPALSSCVVAHEPEAVERDEPIVPARVDKARPYSKPGRALTLLLEGDLSSVELAELIHGWTPPQASKAMCYHRRRGRLVVFGKHKNRVWRMTDVGRAFCASAPPTVNAFPVIHLGIADCGGANGSNLLP